MAVKVKDKIETGLDNFANGIYRMNDRGSNVNGQLLDVFIWQEICRISSEKLKKAWDDAQEKNGVVPTDDEMRALGAGDHIVEESNQFSVTAKVTAPRKSFDGEKFAITASQKWKVKLPLVQKLMDSCRTEGKASLTKRVLEAA